MTLEKYSPEKIDECVLRLFDIAAELRCMAREARKRGVDAVPVHDKKALLWIENLEQWSRKSKVTFEIASSEHWQK